MAVTRPDQEPKTVSRLSPSFFQTGLFVGLKGPSLQTQLHTGKNCQIKKICKGGLKNYSIQCMCTFNTRYFSNLQRKIDYICDYVQHVQLIEKSFWSKKAYTLWQCYILQLPHSKDAVSIPCRAQQPSILPERPPICCSIYVYQRTPL